MIRLFIFTISARVSDGYNYNTIDAKIIGSDRNEVLTTLQRHFPDREIVITSIGSIEANTISKELVDKIYKRECDVRLNEDEIKRSVKKSSFYNIFEKSNGSLWK